MIATRHPAIATTDARARPRPFFVPAIVLLLAVALSACASPARTSNMVVDRASSSAAATSGSPLVGAINLAEVSGGEPTNPMWTSEVGNAEFREALRLSLIANNLLSLAPAQARYNLTADLHSLSQPMIGLDMTVTAAVRYILVEMDSQTGEPALRFNELVTMPYTATFGDSPIGIERLRLANEGAIRENITELLARLDQQVR